MKKYGLLSRLFVLLALLLSHAMCAVVAYHYSALQFSIEHLGFSAPANIAFLLAVPFGMGIAVCLLLAWRFHRRARKGRSGTGPQ